MKIIQDRKNSTTKTESADLLTLFSNLKSNDGSPLFSDTELSEIVLNFVIAGRDTTAQALSWTFYNLAKNPSVKEELMNEIKNQLGNRNSPNFDDVKEMVYAKAVFHESVNH